jgi:hypothetical protein
MQEFVLFSIQNRIGAGSKAPGSREHDTSEYRHSMLHEIIAVREAGVPDGMFMPYFPEDGNHLRLQDARDSCGTGIYDPRLRVRKKDGL